MRVKAVFRRQDFQASPEASEADADAFFAQLAPGNPDFAIPWDHGGMAIVASSPRLATQMGAMSRLLALDVEFSKRADLREIAVQITHILNGCGFGFESKIKSWQAAGLSLEQLAALSVWETSSLFDDEQRLVLEYATAVYDNAVSDELLGRFKAQFSDKAAVECATIVGFWTCWSMVINVAAPEAENAQG